MRLRPLDVCNVCAALSGDAGLPDTDSGGGGETAEPSTEGPPSPMVCPMEDFPLKQSRDDTLRSADDQVIDIDGNLVLLEAARTDLHFQLWNDRLHGVSHDTRTEEHTQLLVPEKSSRNDFPGGSLQPHGRAYRMR